jgi:hypothetical protein
MGRAITFVIWATAVLALALVVVSSSNATAPRAGESIFREDVASNSSPSRGGGLDFW